MHMGMDTLITMLRASSQRMGAGRTMANRQLTLLMGAKRPVFTPHSTGT